MAYILAATLMSCFGCNNANVGQLPQQVIDDCDEMDVTFAFRVMPMQEQSPPSHARLTLQQSVGAILQSGDSMNASRALDPRSVEFSRAILSRPEYDDHFARALTPVAYFGDDRDVELLRQTITRHNTHNVVTRSPFNKLLFHALGLIAHRGHQSAANLIAEMNSVCYWKDLWNASERDGHNHTLSPSELMLSYAFRARTIATGTIEIPVAEDSINQLHVSDGRQRFLLGEFLCEAQSGLKTALTGELQESIIADWQRASLIDTCNREFQAHAELRQIFTRLYPGVIDDRTQFVPLEDAYEQLSLEESIGLLCSTWPGNAWNIYRLLDPRAVGFASAILASPDFSDRHQSALRGMAYLGSNAEARQVESYLAGLGDISGAKGGRLHDAFQCLAIMARRGVHTAEATVDAFVDPAYWRDQPLHWTFRNTPDAVICDLHETLVYAYQAHAYAHNGADANLSQRLAANLPDACRKSLQHRFLPERVNQIVGEREEVAGDRQPVVGVSTRHSYQSRFSELADVHPSLYALYRQLYHTEEPP